MMRELVNEQIAGPGAVRRCGAVHAVDTAAALRLAVDEDPDQLVGRVGRDVAKALVVEQQDVPLATDGVVARTDR
jgi:hypothetical protein